MCTYCTSLEKWHSMIIWINSLCILFEVSCEKNVENKQRKDAIRMLWVLEGCNSWNCVKNIQDIRIVAIQSLKYDLRNLDVIILTLTINHALAFLIYMMILCAI